MYLEKWFTSFDRKRSGIDAFISANRQFIENETGTIINA